MTLLKALKELKQLALEDKVPFPKQGICGNIDYLTTGCNIGRYSDSINVWEELDELFVVLGYSDSYPINSEKEYWVLAEYRLLWVGEHKAARLALIDKCISYIEVIANG